MENKLVAIQKLSRIKLIIGNGFDLQRGMPTSYKDFFNSRLTKLAESIKCYNKYIEDNNGSVNSRLIPPDIKKNIEFIHKNTLWAILFCILSRDNQNLNWCDVEKEMSLSLQNSREDKKITWEEVLKLLNNYSSSYANHTFVKILAESYKHKFFNDCSSNIVSHSRTIFYENLLSDLKVFEKEFAGYLSQLEISKERTGRLLQLLCNNSCLSSIDTFNFTNLHKVYEGERDEFYYHTNFINGSIKLHPIFGIDSSSFSVNDERYIFTKVSRRMENDMLTHDTRNGRDFNNAIVYGHSLNEADYSYFFPLLDQLEMANFQANKKIVFAFSIYDEQKKSEILKALRESIFKLFTEYAKYKGFGKQPIRLIDALTAANRIIMYEIKIELRQRNQY